MNECSSVTSTRWLAAAASAGVGLVILGTSSGPSLTPDSVSYLSVAHNLAAGSGYVDFTGRPLTTFPPGLPALLVVGSWFGLSMETASRIINSAAVAGLVLAAQLLVARHIRGAAIRLGAVALVVTAPGVLKPAFHTWTEPAFSVAVLVFALSMEYGRTGRLGAYWLAGAAVSAGFMLRYSGAALGAAGFVILLEHAREWRGSRSPARWWTAAAGFVFFATISPAVWLARNAFTTQPLMGVRVPAHGLGHFPRAALEGLGALFVWGEWIGFAVVPAAALGVWFTTAWIIQQHNRRLHDRGDHNPPNHRVLEITVVTYVSVTFLSAWLAGSSLDARILSPMTVPLIVLGARLTDNTIHPQREWRRSSRSAEAHTIAAVALVALTATSSILIAARFGSTPEGAASPSMGRSAVAQAARSLGPDSVLLSNRPWGLYYVTRHEPILPTPGRQQAELSLRLPSPSWVYRTSTAQPLYLVWFDRSTASWPYPPAKLAARARVSLQHVKTTSDGTIWRLRRAAFE